jgi:hypothetical protein
MNAEQALNFLRQVLVGKPGLSVDDMAAAVQAWNVITEAVKPQAPQIVPLKNKEG